MSTSSTSQLQSSPSSSRESLQSIRNRHAVAKAKRKLEERMAEKEAAIRKAQAAEERAARRKAREQRIELERRLEEQRIESELQETIKRARDNAGTDLNNASNLDSDYAISAPSLPRSVSPDNDVMSEMSLELSHTPLEKDNYSSSTAFHDSGIEYDMPPTSVTSLSRSASPVHSEYSLMSDTSLEHWLQRPRSPSPVLSRPWSRRSSWDAHFLSSSDHGNQQAPTVRPASPCYASKRPQTPPRPTPQPKPTPKPRPRPCPPARPQTPPSPPSCSKPPKSTPRPTRKRRRERKAYQNRPQRRQPQPQHLNKEARATPTPVPLMDLVIEPPLRHRQVHSPTPLMDLHVQPPVKQCIWPPAFSTNCLAAWQPHHVITSPVPAPPLVITHPVPGGFMPPVYMYMPFYALPMPVAMPYMYHTPAATAPVHPPVTTAPVHSPATTLPMRMPDATPTSPLPCGKQHHHEKQVTSPPEATHVPVISPTVITPTKITTTPTPEIPIRRPFNATQPRTSEHVAAVMPTSPCVRDVSAQVGRSRLHRRWTHLQQRHWRQPRPHRPHRSQGLSVRKSEVPTSPPQTHCVNWHAPSSLEGHQQA